MPRTYKKPVFHTAHYNILAAEIKERLDVSLTFHNNWSRTEALVALGQYYATEALVALAISLAKRFKNDNSNFDPIKFLDACNPNVDLYPLSELWQND